MKISKQSIIALCCATLATFTSPLPAQDDPISYELLPRTLSFSLTAKETTGGTFEVDPEDPSKFATPRVAAFESTLTSARLLSDGFTPASTTVTYATRVVTSRYGNAQLIKELVDGEILEAPASGWALFVATDYDQMGNPSVSSVFARKGANEVDLTELIALELYPVAVTQNFATTTTTSEVMDPEFGDLVPIETQTARGTYASEGSAFFSIQIGENTAEFGGLMADRGSLFTWYSIPEDKTTVDSFVISGGVRISGIAGLATDGQDEEGAAIWLTGTATIGPDKPVKVSYQ